MRMSFQKNSQTDKKNDNNIALNIYAIRYILNLHGATLDINNITGKGSVITIEIPCQKAINEDEDIERLMIDKNSKKTAASKSSKNIDNVIDLFPTSRNNNLKES